MMKPNAKALFLYLSILTVQAAFAFDAKIDGIYYLLDTDAKTATVTYELYKSDNNWSAYRGDVVIPETITYNDETYTVSAIDDYAFYECEYLYSLVIPRTIGRWGTHSFQWCSRLTSLTIYSPMIASQNIATVFGKQVTTVVYGEHVPSIGGCWGCKALISVSLPSSITSLPNQAFYGCSSLTSINMPGITSIGESAFYDCKSLPSVTLSENVKSIGQKAFYGCSALNEITLPNSVDSIKYATFQNCSSLTSITIPSSVKCIEGRVFMDCDSLTSITIPSNVTTISYETFRGCYLLTHVTIPEGVTTIGSSAFHGCSSLSSITIPESVTAIGSSAFAHCSSLSSISLPNAVTSISASLFEGCTGLKEVAFSNNLTSIGDEAFSGCTGLKTLNIPEGIKSIGRQSFEDCSNLNAISIPSSLTSIGNYAFQGCSKLAQVHISDLSAWCKISFELPQIIDKDLQHVNFASNPLFLAHHLYLNEEEIKVMNIPESTNYINNAAFVGCTSLTSVVIPDGVSQIRSYAFSGCSNLNSIYIPSTLSGVGENAFPTQSIRLYMDGISDALIPLWNYGHANLISIIDKKSNKSLIRPYLTNVPTASSITLSVQNYYSNFVYTISADDSTMQFTGQTFKITGLMPRQSLTTSLIVSGNSLVCKGNSIFTTDALKMATLQPKVISAGNVIVAAESNLDDEETNVGFEWRRTDWTNDFASNTGTAYLYEGTMEGYIRNLNTEKLWKFRPYYTSNSGKTYYGEWVGLDPTNTSYFEPTVHTYAKVSVQGNTAEVKGYAMRGSDNVTSQGFMYWKASDGARAEVGSSNVTVPKDATTMEVKGNVMTTTLEGLDYESIYCYVAFVTTSEGETFYGEQQTFTTGVDTSGIETYTAKVNDSRILIYDIKGRRLNALQRGINIIRMSNGTMKKVFVK